MRVERGAVVAYNATDHQADVVLVGSMQGVVRAVPVSHQIGGELMAEGTACCVAFFGEGDAGGLVLSTFDGVPDGWVTPDLLSFTPVTPQIGFESNETIQTLTTTPTTYQTLSVTVTVPEGKTFVVLAVGDVEFSHVVHEGGCVLLARLYLDDAGLGEAQAVRYYTEGDEGSVSVVWAGDMTETASISLKVYKATDTNTERARHGNLAVLVWEKTT